MFRYLNLSVATGAGLGYLPLAPGTWGSLGAVLFYLVVLFFLPGWTFHLFLFCFLCASLLAAETARHYFSDPDPGAIVIDEIAGQWLAFYPLHYLVSTTARLFPALLVVFLVFRFFDVVKVFPINRLQQLPGGWGIALDDWVAGLYTALVTGLGFYYFLAG